MKKEILRINNLNYNHTLTRKLENVSLCILEGECVGFLGLTYSGKDLLVQLLNGDIEERVENYSIYIEGIKIGKREMLKKKIYHITASNYVIDDWTVAEYIGLVDAGWVQMVLRKRILEEDVERSFKELDIPFDVSRKMRELDEQEKRIVDLVKAYRRGAKIVIMEEEFEGMGPDAIGQFARIMKRLIAGRMSVIVSSHSNMILSALSDKYIIFNKGRIVKKCSKSYIQDNIHLEKFLIGDSGMSGKVGLGNYAQEQETEKDIVYRVRGLRLKGKRREDFNFVKGGVVTFLVLDKREKERIFMTLAGRQTEESTYYILNSKRYENVDFQAFAEEKVVSVKNMGSWDEVFPQMTVGENLLLPSLGKISPLDYIISSKKISRMLAENVESNEIEQNAQVDDLEINDLISMTLERWYIYNPKVLVLLEPFAQCDVYGVSILKSYIKKFACRGTAVIIVKTREEYVEDISDQIISID